MNILITGAGGFIGSHLVDRCVADGHYVVGVDRKSASDWSRGKCNCTEELHFPAQALHTTKYFDLCFHLAAESRIQPSFNRPLDYVGDNIMLTARMLETCRMVGAKMVYAGSSTADDDVSKNVYATTKIAGEQLCRAWTKCFGLETAIARFYNVYGPRQVETGQYATVVGIFEKQYREGKKLTVTGDGSQRRDFTHVKDIVDGLMAIALHNNENCPTYNLGTGVNNSILDVARMFVNGNRIEFIDRPPGEAEVTLADYSKTKEELGWQSKHILYDYVNDVKRGLDVT